MSLKGETSGGAQGNHQQDNVLVISDEEDADDDMPVEDSGFSQKISVDKLTYLQGIFPDVQLGCLTKNLAQIGDDDTKFQVFLNKCLADPKRLPRQARVVPSVKRVRPGADAALAKNPVRAQINKESAMSSKKQKKRTVGNGGKGMVKIAYDEFECSLCHCDLLEVSWGQMHGWLHLLHSLFHKTFSRPALKECQEHRMFSDVWRDFFKRNTGDLPGTCLLQGACGKTYRNGHIQEARYASRRGESCHQDLQHEAKK